MEERPNPLSDFDVEDRPPLVPPPWSPLALQVTVRMGDAPLDNATVSGVGAVAPGYDDRVRSHRVGSVFRVRGEGEEVDVTPGEARHLHAGRYDVELSVVRRFRLPRFHLRDADPTVATLIVGLFLFMLQLALLASAMASAAAGGGGFEPSPEYLARLLRGEFDGAEQGVVAQQVERKRSGEAIESFYLQPGHVGPVTEIGGGRNVGRTRQIGDPDAKPAAAAPPETGATDDATLPPPPPLPEVDAPSTDAVADADEATNEDDGPVAVEVNEGWGFTDWYDTEDARDDARQIERELRLARQLLRLDPDDPNGLQIRAYYEYLAMDYAAARRTYDRFTRLYPDEAAGWNNLALTYKRTGDYQKEEQLYRIALTLTPDDDAPLNNLAVNLAHQGRYDEALKIMERLEVLIPDDPYADLHRAKIYAAMGKEDKAYRYLQKSLAAMKKLDTLHNIEFRQDIRVDPVFEKMRHEKRFRDLLLRYYGDIPEGWWQKLLR